MQRVDRQAAVVGQRRQAGQVGRLARLQIGVVEEAVADLLGLGKAEFLRADAGDPERLSERERRASGVPIDDGTIAELRTAALSVGAEPDGLKQ